MTPIPECKTVEKRDSALKVEIDEVRLVFSIGLDRLGDDQERTGIRVTDADECASNICRMLNSTREDGSNLLTDFLDSVLEQICDEGWLGAERMAECPECGLTRPHTHSYE